MRKVELEKIWTEVPVDYYQVGIEKNVFQKLWHKGRVRAIVGFLKHCGFPPNGKIKFLDVGCGSGWFLSEVHKHYPGFQYYGVDVYKKAISYGTRIYPYVSFSSQDAHKLAFKTNFFDVVICMNVLEHVVEPEVVIGELKRVVKPGGVVIIGMDSENLLFSIVWYLWKKFNGKVWKDAHLHKFRPRQLDRLFEKSGLTVERRKYFNLGMAIIYQLRL